MTRQRLKPRTAKVVLYHGDDMAILADLKRTADHAAANGSRTDDGADEKIAYDTFLDEAAERAVEVVIQSIGPRRWQELVMAHPPRMVPEMTEGNRALNETEAPSVPTGKMVEHDDDYDQGVNTLTFPRALLMYADGDFQTIIEPEFEDEADRAAFVDDEIAEGDKERLWRLAFGLNTARGRNPKDPPSDQRSDASTT